MDIILPGEDYPTRRQCRAWLAEHPDPSPRELAESGYVAPHWPRPWGFDASAIDQLVIDEELKRASVQRPQNRIAIGWAGPTIIYAGTEDQKERYLLPLLAGEEIWCQLFSEPDSGSDLASLSTRAVRDGDEWIVTGQKIWTTFAHQAKFGILLARTDPDVPKHEGISYFICPMDAPGVKIEPIVDMTGQHAFNQVFLDEVRISDRNLVGEVNKGWTLAKVTLGNERVSLSGEGALWGEGPNAESLMDLVRRSGAGVPSVLRHRLVEVWIEGEILRLLRMRQLGATLSGQQPVPEASVRKAMGDMHGKHLMDIAKDVAGAYGMLGDAGPLEGLKGMPGVGMSPGEGGLGWISLVWSIGYLYSCALTIGGGTTEVQHNIVAERILGLPKDIDIYAGKTWAESRMPSRAS
ncbi:MAG: acyl-CoA dehydrogenase family protein [Acidimicrobiales bacterium]